MAKSQSGPRINTCPYNTGGTRFFSSAEGSYLYKQPTNLPQPNLSVTILCEVSFQLSVSYDWLSCTSHHDDQLATDHCQLTTVYYCMGLTLSRLPVFFFFCKVTVSPPIFSNDLLVVFQLTISHDIPVLINSSIKTVSGT